MREAYAQMSPEALASLRAANLKERSPKGDLEVRRADAELARRGVALSDRKEAELHERTGIPANPAEVAYALDIEKFDTKLSPEQSGQVRTEMVRFGRDLALPADSSILQELLNVTGQLRALPDNDARENLATKWDRDAERVAKSPERLAEIRKEVSDFLKRSNGIVAQGLEKDFALRNPMVLHQLHQHVQAVKLVEARRRK
jgi:hypothetical protein